jgi:leucyl/phenylalanyl-tRNA--protein transferase
MRPVRSRRTWPDRETIPVPIEPPPCEWLLPDPRRARRGDLVGTGADLAPGTLLAAYRSGLFPMPVFPVEAVQEGPMGWWSPDPRGVLRPTALRVSRSLRAATRRFEIRVDTAFDEVVAACADPSRPHGWISPAVARAYGELHHLGWAHSVEAWADGELAGGLYGVAIGGLFAGESMFHRRTDASKVALVGLVELLGPAEVERRLIDVQWATPHLRTLGVVELARRDYLRELAAALEVPLPAAFAGEVS